MTPTRLISTIALFAVAAFAQNTETVNGHEAKSRQVILKLNAPTVPILQQIRQLGDADDLRELAQSRSLYVLHSRSGNITALTNILKNHPSVAIVEPDYIFKTTTTPNDTSFAQQWGFLNTA